MQQAGTFYLDGPLNIAHRGARDVAPENTMAAFAAAVDAQADGIELDVSRCGTGEIVVMHDDTVDRTTDGSGTVARLGWAAIVELDAGGWFAPEFVGERVPTLAEVLDLVGGRLRVNIEVKHKAQRHDGIEEEIAEMVAQRDLGSSIIISSFDPVILRRFKQGRAAARHRLAVLGQHAVLPEPRLGASSHADGCRPPTSRDGVGPVRAYHEARTAPGQCVDGERGRRHAADDRTGRRRYHHRPSRAST